MALLVSFIPEHLTRLEAKDGGVSTIAKMPKMSDTLVAIGAKTVVTETGAVLGIIGVVPSLPGVCEVFILASKDQSRFPVAFARCIHREVGKLCSKYRRIQAVTEDDAFHRRWITWLGFEYEGVLKKYGLNGQNMVMWSLT